MVLILTTTDSKTIAKKVGNALLKQKLIACYSISPKMESSYWWKGKITSAVEYQVIIKTKAANFNKVEEVIKSLHTYDLPEVISLEITKSGSDYVNWIESELR